MLSDANLVEVNDMRGIWERKESNLVVPGFNRLLYLLSYVPIWWAVLGSNQRPYPCGGCALPTELTAQFRHSSAIAG